MKKILDMGESQPKMETNWPALAAIPQQALKVKRLRNDAVMPAYQTAGAACFDLHAVEPGYVDDTSHPNDVIPTGLAFEVPPGHVMLIFSRSGHGFKNDVRLANCVGVIDSDYRGEVKVKLTADVDGLLKVSPGDRIAQAMLVPIPRVLLVEVDEISDTARGAGGFGSTGA